MSDISPASQPDIASGVSEEVYLNFSIKHPCDFCEAWKCRDVCSEALKFEQMSQRKQII